MAAEADSGQERTEEASEKKLSDARQRGQLPRSRELTTMLTLFAAAGVLWASGDNVVAVLVDAMRRNFDATRALRLNDVDVLRTSGEVVLGTLQSLLPFLVVSAVVSVAGSIALGGWNIAAEALGFKWDRIDPVAGLGRVFSVRSLLELGKALAKFLLLLGFGLAALARRRAPPAATAGPARAPAPSRPRP